MSPPSARSGSGSAEPQRLILASALAAPARDPRAASGSPFESVVPDVDELTRGRPGGRRCSRTRGARRAPGSSWPARRGAIVLGVDTDVVLDGRLLGKPADAARRARAARGALRAAPTRCSAGVVAARHGAGPRSRSSARRIARTAVTFRDLDEPVIDLYVASGEWRDRAGALRDPGSRLDPGRRDRGRLLERHRASPVALFAATGARNLIDSPKTLRRTFTVRVSRMPSILA